MAGQAAANLPAREQGKADFSPPFPKNGTGLGITRIAIDARSGAGPVFVVERAELVRFAAVVADQFLAEFADFVVLRAERAIAFGAVLVSFVRTALAGAVHTWMLQARKRRSKEGDRQSDEHAIACNRSRARLPPIKGGATFGNPPPSPNVFSLMTFFTKRLETSFTLQRTRCAGGHRMPTLQFELRP